MKKRTCKPQRKGISLWEDFTDYRCVVLALMGFSDRFITEETGLEVWQISYRLHLAGVKRKDYRDGSNKFAHMTLRNALDEADNIANVLLNLRRTPR